MSVLPTGTLTLFFTDVEGSTRLQHELGERYDDELVEHHRIIRAALDAHEGHEVDTQGEAFFATFARATDAAAAAADVQRAFAGHAFAVRIGLHTGQPRVAETGYVGLDVPRAARICAAAFGGQVLLSQTTRELIGDAFPTRDLGEHRLKDLIQPIRLHQLLGDGLEDGFPPPRTLETRPTNLPVQTTILVGRTREVEAVSALLLRDDVRLVTLTGAGGTGKTRIALQVAAETVEQFGNGAYFVPLEAVTDPTLVVPAIAQALGVAGGDLTEAVREVLGSSELLLVLDNFEQLADSAPVLGELLLAAPGARMLVTSREPLRLSAEHEFPVPPLAVPELDRLPELAALSQYESVALFLERAQAARPDFAVTAGNA
ncbi:MAG TPA: adenylate/guanylate cyclase domain-containing protein, partial [Gaiellaceae bacterium]|nr:adenylate/guanylate cyclase domain-containing protein [Gaiellaceae bacterium]